MFPIPSITEPSGMSTLNATANVNGPEPAPASAAPSADVDVSPLGQFMGTLALSQKRLGELAGAGGRRDPDAEPANWWKRSTWAALPTRCASPAVRQRRPAPWPAR